MHSSPMHRSRIIEEYAVSTASTRAAVDAMDGTQPGDPAKAARAILEVLDSPEPPPRPALGNDAVDHIAAHHEPTANRLGKAGEAQPHNGPGVEGANSPRRTHITRVRGAL